MPANIPASRVAFVNKDTGAIAKPWFRFLDNLAANNSSSNGGIETLLEYMTPTQITNVTSGAGSIDVTGPVQTAINDGGLLYMPKGKYLVDAAAITASAPYTLFGAGRFQSQFVWTRTTGNIFTIATDQSVQMESLGFQGPAGSVSGAVISLTGSATANSFSIFRDLLLANGYDLFSTNAAFAWNIDNCYFANQVNFGCYVSNTNNVDFGDSTIHGGCVFSGGGVNSVQVHQVSSGGLKMYGNKFLGGAIGYRMKLAAGAVTSDLLIECNSFENQTQAGIQMLTDGGGAGIGGIQILGNQFANQPVPINLNDASGFASRIDIVGNNLTLSAAATFGIVIAAQSDFLIEGNTITGTGGTPSGIGIGASASNGKIGPNKYSALGTKVSNGGTNVFVIQDVPQTGTGGITTNVAYGTMWIGTGPIVFSVAYDSIPAIDCTIGTVPGGVSAFASAITTTGFTLNVIGLTNGGAGQATWNAVGVW